MTAYYEVHDADGHRRMNDGFREDQFEEACRRADKRRGYVVHGWAVVYQSPAYRKKFPNGGGGGAVGPMERVEPPESMWLSREQYAAFNAQAAGWAEG